MFCDGFVVRVWPCRWILVRVLSANPLSIDPSIHPSMDGLWVDGLWEGPSVRNPSVVQGVHRD